MDDPRIQRTRLFAIAGWPPSSDISPHGGGLAELISVDINQDGNPEIVVSFINNAYGRSGVAVFDPSRLSGCGPTLPDFKPANSSVGSEMNYLLLPQTDLHLAFAPVAYNPVYELTALTPHSFRIRTKEAVQDSVSYSGDIIYTFGPHMKVESVVAGDTFILSDEWLEK